VVIVGGVGRGKGDVLEGLWLMREGDEGGLGSERDRESRVWKGTIIQGK